MGKLVRIEIRVREKDIKEEERKSERRGMRKRKEEERKSVKGTEEELIGLVIGNWWEYESE